MASMLGIGASFRLAMRQGECVVASWVWDFWTAREALSRFWWDYIGRSMVRIMLIQIHVLLDLSLLSESN
jgi:hypothetical protein